MSCSISFELNINNDVDVAAVVRFANPEDPNDPWDNTITDMTATLEDSEGADVGSPVDMDYRAASNGFYLGTIPQSVTATLEDGDEYVVHIESDQAGIDIRVELPAKYRRR